MCNLFPQIEFQATRFAISLLDFTEQNNHSLVMPWPRIFSFARTRRACCRGAIPSWSNSPSFSEMTTRKRCECH
jgi:hypothetical protein